MKNTCRIKRFYDTEKSNKNYVIKKVIFSAIAMIAFVGSSMANEAFANKDVVLSPPKTNENPCFAMAIKVMDLLEAEMGIIEDIVEYNTIYQYYIGSCESGLINIE